MNTPPGHRPFAVALWWLPLVAGLLPLAGGLAALWIATDAGLIPRCNPLLEGCVSISRAGRHGLANIVFRGLLLPTAVLQALTWWLVAHWLRQAGESRRRVHWIAPLGIVAGAFLVLYGSFLGTEGPMYQWLRRNGTVVYFGFTCLCMLLAGDAIRARAQAHAVAAPWRLDLALLVLLALLVAMGVVNAMAAPWFDEQLQDRIENVAEWWGGLIFSLVFFTLAALWRAGGLRASLTAEAPDRHRSGR